MVCVCGGGGGEIFGEAMKKKYLLRGNAIRNVKKQLNS